MGQTLLAVVRCGFRRGLERKEESHVSTACIDQGSAGGVGGRWCKE